MSHQPVNQKTRIRLIQVAAVAFTSLLLFAQPFWKGEVHEFLELAGLALVLVCVAGRMWSILYVGSRKNLELVTAGPYSMTRNPLYLFSTIGAVGVGLIFGSIAIAVLLGLFAFAVFSITATKESKHLRTIFGPQYDAYAASTPMFWPKFSQYREPPKATFSPIALRRTFLDGLFFLAAFPALEAIEHLQAGGFLPMAARIF
jgi:protein-S-isoprenylcysteine O-methyltransferase Ste14